MDHQHKLRAKIIARAWKDPAFKQRLLRDPKATLHEMGYDVPKNCHVHIVEDKHNSHTFVLPHSVSHLKEMSDNQIEKIAGGCLDTQHPQGGGTFLWFC